MSWALTPEMSTKLCTSQESGAMLFLRSEVFISANGLMFYGLGGYKLGSGVFHPPRHSMLQKL